MPLLKKRSFKKKIYIYIKRHFSTLLPNHAFNLDPCSVKGSVYVKTWRCFGAHLKQRHVAYCTFNDHSISLDASVCQAHGNTLHHANASANPLRHANASAYPVRHAKAKANALRNANANTLRHSNANALRHAKAKSTFSI